jgi:hypothetical protein
MVKLSEEIVVRVSILSFLFFVIWLFSNNFQTLTSRKNVPSKLIQPSSTPKSIPTIARVLYLFLCENQDEVKAYIKVFSSITADVMFYCWRANCTNANVSELPAFFSMEWSKIVSKYQPFVRFDSAFNYIMIKPRTFIINELQLNLTSKTTWTTARNILLEKAFVEERRQGWRWAYFNFGDGDIQVACRLAEKLLKTSQINGDELIIAQHFRSFINMQQSLNTILRTDQCFILFDTFLLSASPAISTPTTIYIPPIFDGLLTQIVYHIDAMFNAFHRDALPFILPYCARYDARSWHTSQAILIYRSLCLYGHAIQFNAVTVTQKQHREYPRNGDAWAIDNDVNVIPSSLIPLKTYMQQSRLVSALVLEHYHGWSLKMTSSECRSRQTFIDFLSCRVSE